jgi:hypothetical protein
MSCPNNFWMQPSLSLFLLNVVTSCTICDDKNNPPIISDMKWQMQNYFSSGLTGEQCKWSNGISLPATRWNNFDEVLFNPKRVLLLAYFVASVIYIGLKPQIIRFPEPLLATSLAQFPCLAYSSTLKMEVICSYETSVDFQGATRLYITEGKTLQYNVYICFCNLFHNNMWISRSCWMNKEWWIGWKGGTITIYAWRNWIKR